MAPFGPWPPDVAAAPVGLAVSGGADSTALAFLAARWRRNLRAFVVDHGLRPESAEEARLAAARLAGTGVAARILTLPPFPPGRVQERAREARLAALEEACAEAGCLDLLLAHHLHDQDETVSMRAGRMRSEKGAAGAGLAGIAGAALRGRVRLVRPLLDVPPERLRATLRAAGLGWAEDPSNRNRRFERVRLREDLTEGERVQARKWREEALGRRAALDAGTAALLARHARWHAAGWVFLAREGARPDVVGALVRLVVGGRYRPAAGSVPRVLEHGSGTLGGVRIAPGGRFGDGFLLFRESRALEPPVPARAGALWDRRWRLVSGAPEGTFIGALGDDARRFDSRRLGLPSGALRALPALWRDGVPVGLPDVLFDSGSASVWPFVWAGGVPVTGEAAFVV